MDQTSLEYLKSAPPELLKNLSFSVPWQYSPIPEEELDADRPENNRYRTLTREEVRDECWRKFDFNPQINTSVRGVQGRLAGFGFGCSSGEYQIQEVIDQIWFDHRNRLYDYMPKFVGRSQVEGELFNLLTVHSDGFVEVDFLEPSSIGGTQDGTGIIFHPYKTTMPLFYSIKDKSSSSDSFSQQIPSIHLAYDPSLINDARKNIDFKSNKQTVAKTRKKAFQKLGGFYRFVVAWDRGLIVRRTVSYLRTTLEWINQYELLKKYEIDHKRSLGSYAWVFTMKDPTAFQIWLSLSDEDRRKTGIEQKKTPGGSLVLPPGIEVEIVAPQLPTLNEQDTDILKMVGSGLNEEEGVMTGKSTAPYASIKASRGPMSDRISDEIAWFHNWLKYDFWAGIFTLKNKIGNFPEFIKKIQCVGYNVEQTKSDTDEVEYKHTPIWKEVNKKPEHLIDISFPTSEMLDMESRAKGMLGVKHGPISESLGIPNSEISARMGFPAYSAARLKKETEKRNYPPLIYNVDAESLQEKQEAEPPTSTQKDRKAKQK